jgi:hypothetical protein
MICLSKRRRVFNHKEHKVHKSFTLCFALYVFFVVNSV